MIGTHVTTVGKRNGDTTREFVNDLSRRVWLTPDRTSDQRPQISTDGWQSYYPAIREAFTGTVRHGVIIKNYSDPEVGRYAPPELNRARRFSINGIKELWTVCTSHIERFNLTVRTFLERFTRLALGFSKKLDNLKASVSAFIAFYNFCWRTRHKGKSGKLRPTAAMMAGLTDRLWSFADLFDAVTLAEKERKSNAKYARLRGEAEGLILARTTVWVTRKPKLPKGFKKNEFFFSDNFTRIQVEKLEMRPINPHYRIPTGLLRLSPEVGPRLTEGGLLCCTPSTERAIDRWLRSAARR